MFPETSERITKELTVWAPSAMKIKRVLRFAMESQCRKLPQLVRVSEGPPCSPIFLYLKPQYEFICDEEVRCLNRVAECAMVLVVDCASCVIVVLRRCGD